MRVYHFVAAPFAMQAIERQRLKVATINELNDPFELLACDLTNKEYRRGFLNWKKRTASRVGFLCFTRTWRDPLLWSHYADRHHGVALEMEIDDQIAIPVCYSTTRLRLNVGQIMRNGGFSGDLAERLASSKSKHWCYEKEIRVPVCLAACIVEKGLYFEKLSEQVKITGVILGPLSKVTATDLQRVLPRGQKILVRWSRLAFGTYDIVCNKAKPMQVVYGTA